jgi:hypothetical protein
VQELKGLPIPGTAKGFLVLQAGQELRRAEGMLVSPVITAFFENFS